MSTGNFSKSCNSMRSLASWANATEMKEGLCGKVEDAPFKVKISLLFYQHPFLYHTLTFPIIPKHVTVWVIIVKHSVSIIHLQTWRDRKRKERGKNNKRHWIIHLQLWRHGHDWGGLSARRIIGVQLVSSVETLPHTKKWKERENWLLGYQKVKMMNHHAGIDRISFFLKPRHKPQIKQSTGVQLHFCLHKHICCGTPMWLG